MEMSYTAKLSTVNLDCAESPIYNYVTDRQTERKER
jgi:hypothetical protein